MPTRRIRDKDTGTIIYRRIDDGISGSGLTDVLSGLAKTAFTKMTGDAAKKVASNMANKAIEKGSNKVGEKIGYKIANKIDEKFINKSKPKDKIIAPASNKTVQKTIPIPKAENKGETIVKLLRESNKSINDDPAKSKLSQQFDTLIFM